MGNVTFRNALPSDECPQLGSPLRTPFTDFTNHIGHWDADEECLPFELRLIDCAEAYGSLQTVEKCKYYHQDFAECVRKRKQDYRLWDMEQQRYHLWFQGLRGKGPKAENPYFAKAPRYDGYAPAFPYEDSEFK